MRRTALPVAVGGLALATVLVVATAARAVDDTDAADAADAADPTDPTDPKNVADVADAAHVAGATAGPAVATAAKVDARSPRASLGRFLRQAKRGEFASAARFLEGANDARLARHVKLVMDRATGLDLARVPAAAAVAGDDVDAGELTLPGGVPLALRLVRNRSAAAPPWLISAESIASADEAYRALPHSALLDVLPDFLLRAGLRDALWYQWLLLPLLLLLAWLAGVPVARLAAAILRRLVARTRTGFDDALLARLRGPLTLGFTVGLARLALPLLALPDHAAALVTAPARSLLLVALFWALLRAVDVAEAHFVAAWSASRPSSRALLPLAGRITKVAVVVVGVVSIVSALGYPVASLLAGLGIGGLAVALAAQKTFENLFGAFALGIDQPLREGDFVKIDDFVGTVESVGLRSTRVRTLDRTLITIPNGQLAEKRIESFAERDRIRLFLTLGLVYDTTSAQMKTILDGIVAALRAHPKVWPDAVIARFAAFSESSLDVEVMCWFETTDYDEFCAIRTDVFLQLMAVVEGAGSGFAFPTRTLHVAGGAQAAAAVSAKTS